MIELRSNWLDQGMIDNGAVKGRDAVQDGDFVFLDQPQDFGKGRVSGPGIGNTDDPEAACAAGQQGQGQTVGMVPGQDPHEGLLGARIP